MSELVRNKDLKNRVRFSTSLDKDLAKRLDDLSITTRIPKSKLVDEAIEMNAGAIITYHPIIFHGIKRLDPTERVPRILMRYVIFC